MPVRRSESRKTGAAKVRPAAPESLREDAHPETPARDTKQPYASELDDYHGGKAKPPEENPDSAPEK